MSHDWHIFKGRDPEHPEQPYEPQPDAIWKVSDPPRWLTQVLWRAVAALPQVNQELNPDPSRFKGDDRPVERVCGMMRWSFVPDYR